MISVSSFVIILIDVTVLPPCDHGYVIFDYGSLHPSKTERLCSLKLLKALLKKGLAQLNSRKTGVVDVSAPSI